MSWRGQTAKARQPRKRKRGRAMFQCGSCRKRHNNPLGHRCAGGGRFKTLAGQETRAKDAADARAKRDEQRAQETAGRRRRRQREDEQRRARRLREREAAKARKARAAKPRPARPRAPHPYQAHLYKDCSVPSCTLWREAYWQGWADKPPEVIYVGGK